MNQGKDFNSNSRQIFNNNNNQNDLIDNDFGNEGEEQEQINYQMQYQNDQENKQEMIEGLCSSAQYDNFEGVITFLESGVDINKTGIIYQNYNCFILITII